MQAEKPDGDAKSLERRNAAPERHEEQGRNNEGRVHRQVSGPHVEPERHSFGLLELDRVALGELERDLDRATCKMATADQLEHAACLLEESSEQRAGEDVVSLQSLDSTQRERLDRLAANLRRSPRFYVAFAEHEDFPAVRGFELDHDVQWEPRDFGQKVLRRC